MRGKNQFFSIKFIRCFFLIFVRISFARTSENILQKSYLILVSFDGFRWDYVQREITPNLKFMAENGVSALSLEPVFPSKTFPNHLSIITGMYPTHHGIFFAMGPTFKRNYRSGTLRNIDIYPLLCKIFDIFPRENIDGQLERIEFILK